MEMSNLNLFFSLVTEICISKNSLSGVLLIRHENDINQLKQFENSCDGQLKLFNSELATGTPIKFKLEPILQDGLGYASYEQYFENKREWWKSLNLDKVVEHQWLKFKSSKDVIPLDNLVLVANFINSLNDNIINGILILYSHKLLKLSLKAFDIRHFINLLQNLSEAKKEAINKICKSLNENYSEHFSAIQNSFVLALDKRATLNKLDICDLLDVLVEEGNII